LKVRSSLYWATIGEKLALGYSKGKKSSSWFIRIATDEMHASQQPKYIVKKLENCKPDDFEDPDGEHILSYFQAQEKVRAFALGERNKNDVGVNTEIYTVENAIDDYMEWHRVNGKSYEQTKASVFAHIIPHFDKQLVSSLKTSQISRWHRSLADEPIRRRGKSIEIDLKDPIAIRKRKATANRILTVLKAALNYAWNQGKCSSKIAWDRVKPFRGCDIPKERYLTIAECERLIDACRPDFKQLVRAALLTGCRYGELIKVRVHDFNQDAAVLIIPIAKGGKPRRVPLTDPGVLLFVELSAGKKASQALFVRDDGESWGKSHQSRRIKVACELANIEPVCSFHNLRNTYGSLLAMKGVSLSVISNVLGHSDTRITERHYAHLQPTYISDAVRANLPSF